MTRRRAKGKDPILKWHLQRSEAARLRLRQHDSPVGAREEGFVAASHPELCLTWLEQPLDMLVRVCLPDIARVGLGLGVHGRRIAFDQR
jgi:hypothetical protein